MSQPTALPYGIRDCKLTRYVDGPGVVLDDVSVDLPNMQTLSFSETEEFSDMRGDDRIVATRGQGSQVEWEIEAGGMSLPAWSVMSGGEVITSGVTPNRITTLRKRSTDSRPYFRIDGQAISDSGGDVITRIYRARVNDTIEGEFGDGEFFVSSLSGLGLPLIGDFDVLYDFIQRETSVPLTLVPEPNPLGPPAGFSSSSKTATTVGLVWSTQPGATGYLVEQSTDGTTWASATGGTVVTNVGTTSITGLTAATLYHFRIKATGPGGPSAPSAAIQVTTAAS
jgi:hypothetical protein